MDSGVLTCLTWNLWWRFGDWRARLSAITAILRDVQPDICGLQEVWADADTNAARLLAAELGLYWAWVPSPAPEAWQRRIGHPGVDIGNAVLSRWPITAVHHQRLPHGTAPDDGRTILHARVDVPGGPLPFFTTQLTSTPGQSALRCEQVEVVARFVQQHSRPDEPPVLTGDLNAEPESDEVRLLGGHLTAPAVHGLVLVDAWRYVDPPSPGWTWNRSNPHVLVTGEPSARIDYVFVGLGSPGSGWTAQNARLVGDEPVEGIWPSDHSGLLAELTRAQPPPDSREPERNNSAGHR